ncbi:hypothetical protein SOCEGT47_036500 [Sorangium cellulosum]|uniref:DUF4398 domain-containing protein n=1 Tax=Sorangium cellulosum TaxID=56 RepID=A0A4P2Q205_SORCE|nr:DUF4398 domain-containing protein [Sorangium cellulosum]AUX23131.1 hypothetical protein SOCEGT47_036500 [Sorangium cellulosum]
MRCDQWTMAMLLLGGLSGCASAPPPAELVSARKSYERARTSAAAELAPADLRSARDALERAERALTGALGSIEARDLAYVAERRAQLAESLGKTAAAERQRGAALQAYGEVHLALRKRGEAELLRREAERSEDPGASSEAGRARDPRPPEDPRSPRPGRQAKTPERPRDAERPPLVVNRR